MVTPIDVLRNQARGVRASATAMRRFRGEISGHWATLLGAVLCAMGYTAMRIAEPWPLKFIFDNVLTGQPLETPFPWLNGVLAGSRTRILLAATLALLMLAALRGVFYYYQTYLTSRVGQAIVLNVRRKLFAHIQRLSVRFHHESSTGDLLTRLTGDINNLRELLVASAVPLVSETVILVGFVGVMFAMNWRLALLAIVTIPLIFGLVRSYSSRIRQATREQRRREGELASRLQEALTGIQVVQLLAREPEEDARLRDLNQRSLDSGLQASRLGAKLNQGVELSVALGMAATLWFGTTEVIAGRLTPGELIVFVTYMQSFYRPLRRISRFTERASKASSCVERITEVLDQEPDVRGGPVEAPRFRGEIRFKDVGFSYADGGSVLRDIDLTIAPGQTVALVGPSGAGKSTLIGMIPRLHDATRGTIEIDGRDVREFTLESLRDGIAVVPQDGMLFKGTIRENIAYGKLDATDAEIEAAARAARIHDHIASLPEGYETVIGERGVSLSGGQRQRLAIARAIVKDAPIVLLDEPTTGLDAAAERLVMEAFDHLLRGRTAVVIAHRLATIRRADLIVVVENGRIVERGSHAELFGLGGRYRVLHDLQFAGSSAVTPAAEEPALAAVS
ncbi:MAG: ABC transporter ATP-binding protein/permease [Chloroflexota bacterium]|nr:ABC transporter ATP-binding protein/permease [Chloroflexota bacterium]